MTSRPVSTDARLGACLHDLTDGLRQQMFFWGRDVMHPDGNLLEASGFTKRQSTGLQGTSCYRMPWRDGHIDLHGACAGWYGGAGSFVFIRPIDRGVGWRGDEPPVPGHWDPDRIEALAPPTLRERLSPFLDWWIAYEEAIHHRCGPAYRERCHREFKKAPRSKPWLKPELAQRWLRAFREDPHTLPRARRFVRTS